MSRRLRVWVSPHAWADSSLGRSGCSAIGGSPGALLISWRTRRKQTEIPAKTHLVVITDLYEEGGAKQSGLNLIVLLALSDVGHPAYEAKHAEAIASLGCPVFACTPDQFPSMMAAVLAGKDLAVRQISLSSARFLTTTSEKVHGSMFDFSA